eukprot:UN34266
MDCEEQTYLLPAKYLRLVSLGKPRIGQAQGEASRSSLKNAPLHAIDEVSKSEYKRVNSNIFKDFDIPQKLNSEKAESLAYNLKPVANMIGGTPAEDEEDYQIVYNDKVLGFDLYPGAGDKNALVGDIYSQHALRNIFPNSMLVSIDCEWLYGRPFQTVCDTIFHAMETNPPYVLRFR